MKIKVGEHYDAFDSNYVVARADRNTKFDLSGWEWTFLIIAKIKQDKKTAYVGIKIHCEISDAMAGVVYIFDANGVCLSSDDVDYKIFCETPNEDLLPKDIKNDSDK